jgi:hypothetical protein
VYTEPVLFFPVPHPCPFAVQAGLPFPEYYAVALSAEIIRFLEADQLSVCQSEGVPVVRIVTVQTPPAGQMFQGDFLMHLFEFARFFVGRQELVAL